MKRTNRHQATLLASAMSVAVGLCPAIASASAHQTHLLVTELAALRLINDPNTPKGLRDFLSVNLKCDMADCEKLATQTTVGHDPAAFTQPLNHWVTWTDVFKTFPEGKDPIEPYGVGEGPMHYLNVEVFGPHPYYADDMSNKPSVADFPHDVADPRYKTAGFLPLRLEECFNRSVAALANDKSTADDTAHWMGYLAHYTQEGYQPHHTTIDQKGITDLAGKVSGLPAAATRPNATGRLISLRAPSGVDPHGDIEFQIFSSDQPPIEAYRQEFWATLQKDIAQLPAPKAADGDGKPVDPFTWDLAIILHSYDSLPYVGKASAAAYAKGKFNPRSYFEFSDSVYGQQMTMPQFIAWQDAQAVQSTDAIWLAAWDKAHPAQP